MAPTAEAPALKAHWTPPPELTVPPIGWRVPYELLESLSQAAVGASSSASGNFPVAAVGASSSATGATSSAIPLYIVAVCVFSDVWARAAMCLHTFIGVV